MRSAALLTLLIGLGAIGYLVIQNMESHMQDGRNGGVMEIDQARKTAVQVQNKADAVRQTVNRNP